MSFDQFETRFESKESAPNFENARCLYDIFSTIQQMEDNGQMLPGSSREYSPSELREAVAKAAEAISNAIFSESDVMKRFEIQRQAEHFSEVNFITRSGGLRDAFIRLAEHAESGFADHYIQDSMRDTVLFGPDTWRIALSRVQSESENQKVRRLEAEKEPQRRDRLNVLAQQMGIDLTDAAGRQALVSELHAMAALIEEKKPYRAF